MKKRIDRNWYIDRKYLISSYNEWKYCRIVKIALVFWVFYSGWLTYACCKTCRALAGIALLIVIIISLNLISMCQTAQNESQSGIDRTLLGRDTYHFAEVFPHKGIRMHRRQHRLYKRRIRYFARLLRKRQRIDTLNVETSKRGGNSNSENDQ